MKKVMMILILMAPQALMGQGTVIQSSTISVQFGPFTADGTTALTGYGPVAGSLFSISVNGGNFAASHDTTACVADAVAPEYCKKSFDGTDTSIAGSLKFRVATTAGQTVRVDAPLTVVCTTCYAANFTVGPTLTPVDANVVQWNGGAVATPATGGIPEVNVKNINNLSTSSVTTVVANIGTTQPVNFTGTGASALVKTDVLDWTGTAVATPTTAGYPLVDVAKVNNVATTSVTTVSANQGTTQPVNFTGTGASALAKSDTVDWTGTAVATPDTAGYPKVTVKDGTGTGEIDTTSGGIAHVVLTDTATGVTNNVGGNVAGNVNGTINGLTATALANFFNTNSGSSYGASVAGSVVKEIADNAGMVSIAFALKSGTSDSGTTTTMVDAARTEADTNYWKGDVICFTSGNLDGQCRYIEAFNAATDTITFAPATTQAVATQNYSIYPSGNNMDVLQANHAAASTIGASINAFAAAADPLASVVPGAYAAGTAGYNIGSYLNATISSRSTQTSVDNVQTDTTNIKTRLPAALTGAGFMSSDAVRLGGTAQTGRDIGASVLLSNGAGTGQVKLSGGYVSPNFGDFTGTLGSSAFAASAVTLFQAGLISLPKGVAITGYAIFAHQTGAALNVGVTGKTTACTRAINNGAGFGAFASTGLSGAAEVGLGNYSINFDNTIVGNETIINCTFTGAGAAADIFQQYITAQR